METQLYSVKLSKLITKFSLQSIWLPEDDREITCPDVNRPGLPLSGFFDMFAPERIQIIGRHEYQYMKTLSTEERYHAADRFLAQHPSAVILTSSLVLPEEFVACAQKYAVPVLGTSRRTSEFMAMLISYLHVELAPRITRHGVFVEVYGEGILMLGDSGIGKSETAIELVKRGHRLIADDAVELKRVSDHTLVGSAPEMIRHYVELRGIGIIDVKRIFGMGAIMETGTVNMIISLEPWEQGKMYDRLGLDTQYTDIMGIKIPTTVIPVKPGRNLAVILEIAAMNNRQKKLGYDTAVEFNKRLMRHMRGEPLEEDD